MKKKLPTFLPKFLTLFFALAFSVSAFSQTTIITKEDSWNYLDDGSNQGTAWIDSNFNDASWTTANGIFGMGGISGATINETITKNITTYFRKEVTISNPDFTGIYLNLLCDDGIVIYINEKEAMRYNMPSGSITYTTTALTYVSGSDEGDYDLFFVPDTFLQDGVNTFAVELHNNSATSSDLGFDLEVTAEDLSGYLIPKLGEWKYLDDGSDQGTAWQSLAFVDTAWESGDAVLGYGAISGASVATTLSYGGNPSDKHPTTYFRKEVDIINPDFAELEIRLLADDGAAVYINGKLAFEDGLPSTWDYQTYANHTAAGSDEGDYELFVVPDTFLVNGTNIFAVEVHQTNASSSDLGFDLDVKGIDGVLVHGEIFLDLDGNGVESIYDTWGSGAIEIRMYDDVDSNGIYPDSELVKSILTNPHGEYKSFVPAEIRHLAVKLMTEDMAPEVEYTTDTTHTFIITTQDSIQADFGQLGPRSLCLLVADMQGAGSDDQYYMSNRITGKNQYISTLNIEGDIEAAAIRVGMDSMWVTDAGQFGTVGIIDGTFTPVGTGMGTADGYVAGVMTSKILDDVDGLAYDGINHILYGTNVESGENDILFAVDRVNGTFIPDFFGAGIDFVEISGTNVKQSIDDIAFNPFSNQLLAINSQGNGDSTRYITIDPTNGAATVLSIAGVGDFEGFGYYNSGELYGTTGIVSKPGYPANTTYKVNRNTGVGTKIDTLASGAIDVEGCDCLTGPLENLISGVVFYDADSSGTYNKDIDSAHGGIKLYLYTDADGDGEIDTTVDVIIDSTFTAAGTGFYVFIIDSTGDYITTPWIYGTIFETMQTTTDDSLTEDALFTFLGDFDGKNDFGFHQTAGAPYLPVQFLKVTAAWEEEKDGLVEWSTATEVNASHFVVERAVDSEEFTEVGTVAAKGSSTSQEDYNFIDEDAIDLQGKTIFYRIKEVDFDETSLHSNVVSLNIEKIKSPIVKVYPNPVQDVAYVELNAVGEYTIDVTDLTGSTVIHLTGYKSDEVRPIRVDGLNQLRSGIYFIHVRRLGEDAVAKILK